MTWEMDVCTPEASSKTALTSPACDRSWLSPKEPAWNCGKEQPGLNGNLYWVCTPVPTALSTQGEAPGLQGGQLGVALPS